MTAHNWSVPIWLYVIDPTLFFSCVNQVGLGITCGVTGVTGASGVTKGRGLHMAGMSSSLSLIIILALLEEYSLYPIL